MTDMIIASKADQVADWSENALLSEMHRLGTEMQNLSEQPQSVGVVARIGVLDCELLAVRSILHHKTEA